MPPDDTTTTPPQTTPVCTALLACVYKDSTAWVTHELLRMCAYVGYPDRQLYTMWSKGRCPSGTEIKSISECSAAAKATGAPDKSASFDGLHGSNSDPPFCYYKNGEMKFNAGNNKGYCQQSYACLCAAAPTTSTTTTPFNTSSGAFPWRDGYMHCFTLDQLS